MSHLRKARLALAAIAALAAVALTGSGLHGTTVNPVPVTANDVSLAAQSDSVPQPDIVGGRQAVGAYPWIASFQLDLPGSPTLPPQKDAHNCTAWQFAQFWLAINAHCVTFANGTPFDAATIAAYNMKVRVGSLDRTQGGIVDKVAEVITVPGWNWGQLDAAGRINDNAVVRVVDPLPGQALPVATATATPGQAVRLLGWGYTDPSGTGVPPQKLQMLDSHVADSPHECDTGLGGVDGFDVALGEICVRNVDGTDAFCYGDSGSPLVSKKNGLWFNYGGASRTPGLVPGCGGENMVYTDMAYFRPWDFAVARGESRDKAMDHLPVPAQPKATHGPGPQVVTQVPVNADAQRAWRDEYALAR